MSASDSRRSERRPARAWVTSSIDYPLLAIVAAMLAIGLALVFSASYAYKGTDFFVRQTLWIGLGLAAAFFMANIDYRVWRTLAVPVMILALALLVAVLLYGEEINGATRTFGGSIQPGEFTKLAVVVYVAAWVASKGSKLSEVREGLLPFVLIMAIVTILLVLEPSLSVAMIVLIIGIAIFYVGGGHIGQMLMLAVMSAPAVLFVLYRSNYAAERLSKWLLGLRSPGSVAADTASIFVGQPSFAGKPFVEIFTGFSSVPLPWSDYLFAYVAEVLGFLGTLLIVVLYAALAYRLLAIALNAQDRFATFMAVGITAWILAQALIHIGASTRLLPETGQPLPFMSYGGSAMLVSMAAMGLMQSIARASPAKKALHANLVFGRGDGRPRLPDSGRSERAETARQRSRNSGVTATRTGAGGRARAQGAAYSSATRAVKPDDGIRKPAWRSSGNAGSRRSRNTSARNKKKPSSKS